MMHNWEWHIMGIDVQSEMTDSGEWPKMGNDRQWRTDNGNDKQ